MAIEYINDSIGCGACAINCPAYVIRQAPKPRKAFIKYQAECQSRHKIFKHFLADANRSGIDVDRIISEIPMFTPAEIG